MDTFNQLETGCWLFHLRAYRLRTKKRMDDEILNGRGIPVEGLYTKQNERGRFNGNDIFDSKMATLAIDGQFINGVFYKMSEVKTYFYSNIDHIPAMLTVIQIGFKKKKDILILDSLGDEEISRERHGPKYYLYAFCINTVLDDLDMMAAKLVTE